MSKPVQIEPQWHAALKDYFETEHFKNLTETVRKEYLTKQVFPEPKNIFNAFWKTPFNNVKVVILGQDPYHDVGQAMGMCFSVPEGVKLPPSLQNIYKEIEADTGTKKDFALGDLTSWAEQGVFLLNSCLTVEAHKPASHKDIGWTAFTDHVIETLSNQKNNLVFLLWGNFAKSKVPLIDQSKHLVLEAAHPSPFSAYSGFFDCKHFSKTNEYLSERNIQVINW